MTNSIEICVDSLLIDECIFRDATILSIMAFSITTLSITTFSIMTLSMATFSIMTLRMVTFSITTLSIVTLDKGLIYDNQHT